MKATTIPKAEPVEGEELQKLLDENGVKSSDEISPDAEVITGEGWDDLLSKLERKERAAPDH